MEILRIAHFRVLNVFYLAKKELVDRSCSQSYSLIWTLNACFPCQKYCNQQENIEKPTVASFRLTTRNLKVIVLLCTLPILCTPVSVQHRLSFSTQIVL